MIEAIINYIIDLKEKGYEEHDEALRTAKDTLSDMKVIYQEEISSELMERIDLYLYE